MFPTTLHALVVFPCVACTGGVYPSIYNYMICHILLATAIITWTVS